MGLNFDVCVVGGGIVGLATAWQYQKRFPNKSVVVVEKEHQLAHHQTGHNSGVLHSGIYYKPGSLKAENCRDGKKAMEQFCAEHDVDYEICGKVIVAIDDSELPALERIYTRGQENGVLCEMIDRDRLLELEPHVAGIKAIHVPESGIVNYRQVCEKLAELVKANGGEIKVSTTVLDVKLGEKESTLVTNRGDIHGQIIVNCAGLHCDRIARKSGAKPPAKIVPFRGEYYELKSDKKHLCKNLIYPVPNPKFPFLGVHFTRMIDGSVECGPNAVLAFAREGYRMRDINLRDLFESLTYGGFIKMALKHWRMGMGEMWRSFSKQAFVKALKRLMPEIQSSDLVSAPAGVRAQAVMADGSLVDDFLIVQHQNMININNAPSPAATASLNIGKLITDQIETKFHSNQMTA